MYGTSFPSSASVRPQNVLARLGLIIAVWLLIITASRTPAGAVALRVDQLEFDVTAAAGETVPLSLEIENTGDEPAVVNVYAGDWRRTPQGEHVYLKPGTLERSASKWIRIAPAQFQLEPGEQNIVRFTVTLPSGPELNGTHWSMIFVEPNGRPSPETGTNIRVLQRIGVKVHVTPKGVGTRTGRVERVEAVFQPEKQAVEVTALFANTGPLPLKPQGWVKLVDQTGQTAAQAPLQPFPVLPGDSNLFRAVLPTSELAAGTHAVIAALDFGASQMVGGQAQVEILGQQGADR